MGNDSESVPAAARCLPRMRRPRRAARHTRSWLVASVLLLGCRDPEPAAPDPGEPGGSSGDETSSSGGDDAPLEIPAGCGNGILETDEECDLAFANATDGACTPECTVPRCGDGHLGGDEACDEGADNGGPTCSDHCTRPTRLRWSTLVAGSAHGYDLGVAMVPVALRSAVSVRFMEEEDPYQVVIERYEPDGARPWSTTLSGPLRYYGLGASLVPAVTDDGVLLALFADEAEVEGSGRIELLRLSTAGELRWDHTIRTSVQGTPLAGQVTMAGEQVVFTALMDVGAGPYQTFIVRLDDDGHVLGERFVPHNVRSVVGAADGGLFAHGNGRLVAFDADDELRWDISMPADALSLAVDGQGRLLVARRESSGERVLEARAATGELVWDAALEVSPRALAVGRGDVIAVAGDTPAEPMELPSNTNLAVEVFAADGARQWLDVVDGPGHGEDAAQAVAIAGDGAIWVNGSVAVPFEERDVWIGRFEEELQ
jgi:hypothetical protein